MIPEFLQFGYCCYLWLCSYLQQETQDMHIVQHQVQTYFRGMYGYGISYSTLNIFALQRHWLVIDPFSLSIEQIRYDTENIPPFLFVLNLIVLSSNSSNNTSNSSHRIRVCFHGVDVNYTNYSVKGDIQTGMYTSIKIRHSNLEKIKARATRFNQSIDDLITNMILKLDSFERQGDETAEDQRSW